MPGHVFVTHADLTRLWCDAWLVPCDVGVSVSSGWRSALDPDVGAWVWSLRADPSLRPGGWGDDGVRVIAWDGWPAQPVRPRPYLVNVGALPGTHVDWFVEGARQFFGAVAASRPSSAIGGRSKPLIGLPLIGTGAGGAASVKGTMVRAVLESAEAAVVEYDFDVVLVTRSSLSFVAAQNARRQASAARRQAPDESDDGPRATQMDRELERLASHAANQRLVLFLGAGVSRGAGLPTWDELLATLATTAGLSEREQAALARMHHLDRARIIEARLVTSGQSLGQVVRDALQARHYALSHSLLASLPVSEVVTTNYDLLFEQASADAGRAIAVLPYQPLREQGRWLLKLHGSISHPDDIVLTREDYLRYADRRAALSGIVQALLITRHMLFVGFSLADDNFHRIVDDVRKAIRGTEGGRSTAPFGTTLLLRSDDLLAELWAGDLELVSMTGAETGTTAEAVRALEIALDTLLAVVTQGASPLLDPDYDGVLTDEEREVRRLLIMLTASATDVVKASPAWRPIADLLTELGGSSSRP